VAVYVRGTSIPIDEIRNGAGSRPVADRPRPSSPATTPGGRRPRRAGAPTVTGAPVRRPAESDSAQDETPLTRIVAQMRAGVAGTRPLPLTGTRGGVVPVAA
jgi:hypothetical protein